MKKIPETFDELVEALKEFPEYVKDENNEYDRWCDFIEGASIALEKDNLLDCTYPRNDDEPHENCWRFIKQDGDKYELRFEVWDTPQAVPIHGYLIMPKGQEDIGEVRLVSVSRIMCEDYPDTIEDIVAIYEKTHEDDGIETKFDLDHAFKKYYKKEIENA